LVLVAGMALGTAFTLFFVPAIYVLLARDHRKASQSRAADAEVSAEQPFEEKVAAGA
jgi:multidrug efflux pump